jgi:hypothetical protein
MSSERWLRVRLGRAERMTSRGSSYQSFRRGGRFVRESHPFGIPNGRERTTLGCRRCDSCWSHIEHRVCSPGRSDASDHWLGCGQRDSGSISQTVGTGIEHGKSKNEKSDHSEILQRGSRIRMVGSASFRNRSRNPATDEAETAADVGQSSSRGEAISTYYAADCERGLGNGAPFGCPKGFGISDLYQDATSGSFGEECG